MSSEILLMKTVQIAPFRTLMTALKDILIETNITFTPEGMKIINMDKSHTVLVHLDLKAENFEHYECNQPKIIIGVNMFHFFKLINTIDNDDTLTFYIDEADYNDGIVQHLGLKFENGDIKQQKNQKLRLIEPDSEELAVPGVTFSSILNIPSGDFQKIVRDLSSISDKIEINSIATANGAELIFKCSGAFAQPRFDGRIRWRYGISCKAGLEQDHPGRILVEESGLFHQMHQFVYTNRNVFGK